MRVGRCVLLVFVCLLIAVATGGETPQPELKLARTPARLARGKYLVENLAHCFDCHGDHELNGAIKKGTEGAGRVLTTTDSGIPLPHFLVCPNITPDRETGAGTWTDAQFVRAIREGIGHDGRILARFMPYWNFRFINDEDLASIVVYIRSIPAVHNPLPKRNLPAEPTTELRADMIPPLPPDASPLVRRGEYLAHIGNCTACHTPIDRDFHALPGMLFGGGRLFVRPWGTVASANLTQDPSGIKYYDEAQFLRTIRTGHVGARALNVTMPWEFFRHLSDDDLKAIFAYVRAIPPVQHRVDNTEPPTLCPKDGARHGYGDRN